MIVVSGLIAMNPDRVERALELIRPLVAATRAEPGNVSYEFFAALEEPGRYRVFEEWESAAALEFHRATPHLAAFYAAAGELDISSVELFEYEVSAKTPM